MMIYAKRPVGYLTLDRSGLIFQANLFIARLLVVEKPGLLGMNLNGFISPDAQDAYYSFLEEVFVTKSLQSCAVSIRKDDGSLCSSKLEGIYINNSGSCEPIPLCRVAVLPCQANTAVENDKIIEKFTPVQDKITERRRLMDQ
jgi:PAS domain-containing protein